MGKGDDSGASAAREANIIAQQGVEELRRQFGVTQETLDPFIQAGVGQLGTLQEASTVGGFGARLAEIFGSGALDPLIEERTRAAQLQLAAGGLTRSGTALEEISAIPQGLGFGLENLLFGRSQNLATAGQQAGLGLGKIGGQSAGNIANVFSQQGQNLFKGINADAQRQSDIFGDILGLVGTVGGAALGGPFGASLGASLGSSLGGGGGGDSGIGFGLRNEQGTFFSDRNLKENIEKIGEIGPLSLYQWDWIPETKDMVISKFPTMGFVADEVKEHFPEFVKNICGFDCVNYRGVLDRIEGALIQEGVA